MTSRTYAVPLAKPPAATAPHHPLQRLDMHVEIVTEAAQHPRLADLDDTELVI